MHGGFGGAVQGSAAKFRASAILEPTLMMMPRICLIIWGNTARLTMQVPVTFTSTTCFQRTGLISSRGSPKTIAPALLNRTSIWLYLATA